MTNISDTSLVSVLSVKGGTGKTTTTLCLASLLAENMPMTIIEGQRENPQYQSLLFPEGSEVDTINIPYGYDRHFSIIKAENSPVFQGNAANNLSLFLLDRPGGRINVEGLRLPVVGIGLGGTHTTITDSELRVGSLSKKMWALSQQLDSKRHVMVIDYDAGLGKQNSKEVLPFHRAVHGYGVEQAVKEYVALNPREKRKSIEDIRHFMSPSLEIMMGGTSVTKALPMHFGEWRKELDDLNLYEEEKYSEKDRLGKGVLVFVASPAMAEIKGLADRSFFFRDLGPNNHYVLVINQARDEDVKEISGFLREKMGDSYMFSHVFGLPHIPYMDFGNMLAGGDPYLLPTYSDLPRYQEYNAKLGELADRISSHYI